MNVPGGLTALAMAVQAIGGGGGGGAVATGGYAYQDGAYAVHEFAAGEDFVVSESVDIEYLIVAGGGGGGGGTAGGGGAGGVLAGTATLAAGTYPVVVGMGGQVRAVGTGAPGVDGTASTFNGLTAVGGGGGGQNGTAGRNGGAGGGGSYAQLGGTGISGQGFAGGNGSPIISNYSCGGGGGAGAVGGAGADPIAGNGGAGVASSISGVATYYAGGGGGGTYGGGTIGVGGVGGGANGGTKDAKQVTGGGGGGGLDNGTGGRGGSGLVIVRYLGTAPAVDLTTGLVGEWLFDSQDATDTSGNGFDGVITGSPSYAVGHNGSGYSIVMTGTEYATVPHDAALDLRTTFSISYWLKYTVDGNFTVMEKSPIYNAFGVGTFPPGCFSQTTPGRVDGPGGYNDGTWHHGCVTYDFATTTVKVYVDGSLRGQNTAASRPASTTTPLLIGSRSGSWGVQGGMDDLRIYNRVLTAGEIRALASM